MALKRDSVVESLKRKEREIQEMLDVPSKHATREVQEAVSSYAALLQGNRSLLEGQSHAEYERHKKNLHRFREALISRQGRERFNAAPYALDDQLSAENPDESFAKVGSRKMNTYILSAIDTLESLKEQGKMLDRTKDRLLNCLRLVGMNDDLIDRIKSKYSSDYIIFISFCVAIAVLIFILKIIF